MIPCLGYWVQTHDGDRAARAIFERHYSCHTVRPSNGQFVGPGYKIVLVTSDYSALFVWRKFISDSGESGVNCAVFRNESRILSSSLILEAEKIAWARFPGERLYTYVDGKAVNGDGLCFKRAGWRKLKRRTKANGLIILEKLP